MASSRECRSGPSGWLYTGEWNKRYSIESNQSNWQIPYPNQAQRENYHSAGSRDQLPDRRTLTRWDWIFVSSLCACLNMALPDASQGQSACRVVASMLDPPVVAYIECHNPRKDFWPIFLCDTQPLAKRAAQIHLITAGAPCGIVRMI